MTVENGKRRIQKKFILLKDEVLQSCHSGTENIIYLDSRHYQIFWEVVGLERGPLSLVSTIEELLGRKGSSSGLENRGYGRKGSATLTTRHPSIRKSRT
jgi:hypothetical protein